MAKTATKTAKDKDKDVLARLADRGEEALQRFVELPGGTRALKAFNDLRANVDELGKKVRGIDRLEARVDKLEKELAALKRQGKPAASRTTTRSKATTPRKPAA
jgi:outer membrane murein-binding lipoprotein Lpp